MRATEEDGLTPKPLHPIPPAQQRHLYLYLLPIVVFPLLIVIAAFFIVPTRWFLLHSGNTYMANLAFADRLQNSDCQVLVYGDSTALTSVNSLLIEQLTHLKTCNVAEFEGMTSVNTTMLIDKYLTRNPRPQFMVFMYTPDDLRIPEHWNKVSSFEAVTYRVQQGLDPKTVLLLAEHPVDTLGWAEQGMRMSIFRFRTAPIGADKMHIREPFNGQLRLSGVTSTECDPVRHTEGPDLDWVAQLRSKYGVGGTQVIVDATPVPSCDLDFHFFQTAVHGVVDDDPLPGYPVTDFLKNSHFHMNDVGSKLVSTMIADQILGRLHRSTPSSTPAAAQDPTSRGGL